MSLRLLLLPLDPQAPLRCLHLDGEGRVLEALNLAPDQSLPAGFGMGASSTVLMVPGSEVAACLTELPARDPAQALAAAKLMLPDRAAEAVEGLHIAIGPLQVGKPRLLAWVKPEAMRQWLDRAAQQGVDPDRVMPDYLALPQPDSAVAVVAERGGQWLVRGAAMAFSAEPAVARQVLGERAFEWTAEHEVEALLAVGASVPGLDLLQGDFSRRTDVDTRQPGVRRLMLLSALVLLSPLLLVLADALRYHVAARGLQRDAAALASPFLQPGTTGEGPGALASVLERRLQPARAGLLRQALFDSIAATPGTRLEVLRYGQDEPLQATVVHATPVQLQQLTEALQQRHASAREQPEAATTDGLVTRLSLEYAP